MARRASSNGTKATRHKAAPVEVRNIAHPRLWKTALKLANGNAKLITVDSYVKLSVVVAES